MVRCVSRTFWAVYSEFWQPLLASTLQLQVLNSHGWRRRQKSISSRRQVAQNNNTQTLYGVLWPKLCAQSSHEMLSTRIVRPAVHPLYSLELFIRQTISFLSSNLCTQCFTIYLLAWQLPANFKDWFLATAETRLLDVWYAQMNEVNRLHNEISSWAKMWKRLASVATDSSVIIHIESNERQGQGGGGRERAIRLFVELSNRRI